MAFSDLKKSSVTNIDKLTKELDKLSEGSNSYKDDRFWKPELDKSGNGYAVIRFLPPVDGEELPWARYWSHGFKGKGGWYIEKSLTTLGKKDPVSELNSELWNTGLESDKDIARQRRRKLNYVSNIMVVHDPSNPENDGKIFLYRFGKKIFDKIQEAMKPEFEDETPINPFDFWQGANFKLKVRKVAGFINYDKSEFESASALLEGDDSKLEELWKNQHALSEFTDPTGFKSYDELKKRLSDVIGSDVRATVDDYQAPTTAESQDISPSSAPETKVTETSDDSEEVSSEDAFSYFEKLANEE